MPDLGRYTAEVLLSYGVSLLLLGAIVWISARAARRVAARLSEVENGRD